MMALVERTRRPRRFCRAWMLVAVLFGAFSASHNAFAADTTVTLDQAKVIRIPERTSTVVVGNPLIADISIQTGGLMVVTGKGYGVTNLIALDNHGNALMEHTIEVQGPSDNVLVMYRGVDRETYSCTPKCERRITLGDTPAYFEALLQQTGRRDSQAAAGPSGAGAR